MPRVRPSVRSGARYFTEKLPISLQRTTAVRNGAQSRSTASMHPAKTRARSRIKSAAGRWASHHPKRTPERALPVHLAEPGHSDVHFPESKAPANDARAASPKGHPRPQPRYPLANTPRSPNPRRRAPRALAGRVRANQAAPLARRARASFARASAVEASTAPFVDVSRGGRHKLRARA